MTATITPNLGLSLPEPNVDANWGVTLNADFTLIDNLFASSGSGTSVGINVGSGKTLLIGGTLLLGTGDGTGTLTVPTIRGPARTGSDVQGSDITIQASNGTGTGGSGRIIFQTAPAGSAGTTANSFQNALIISRSSAGNMIDVGAGGTGSTYARSSMRINGSSAGDGTNGGSVLRIANNSVNTGAFGNRSAVFGGTTAYDSTATLWGDNALSFVVGSGTLAASNEKVRVGSSGQIYLWDTSLGTPALNAGVAGQVLTSNGSSMEPAWKNPGINTISAQTFTATGNSFTSIPAGVTTITMIFTGLDPSSTADALVQIGTSSGFVTTGYSSSGSSISATSAATSTSTTGFLINLSGSVGSGSVRLTKVTGNTWVSDHSVGTTSTKSCTGGGFIALPSTLDRVQIVPSTGTFAASGSVSLMYL